MSSLQVYKAFIASPSDVHQERGEAENAITEINRAVGELLGVRLECKRWEHLPPVAPDLPKEKLQDVLNREVETAHFFILILGRRYGTVDKKARVSNTEREIQTILKARQSNPKLKILAYFKQSKGNGDRGPQEKKVLLLRRRLETLGLPHRVYDSVSAFRDQLTHDLYQVLLGIQLSPFKKHALRQFWQLGSRERESFPLLGVFYPPVDRSLSRDGGKNDYWLRKLSTLMAFEDYKAIQKLEKCFHLIGVKAYRIYPHTNVPPEKDRMNRAWLCLPRNRPGQQALRAAKGLKFRFESGNSGNSIIWKQAGSTVRVFSPMAEYLRRQRQTMKIDGEWHRELSDVVAKDFAVLARVPRPGALDDKPLWDYFFAGIRGLGTWGAAWFVDQEYKFLKRFGERARIELLLEVTLKDGRIVEVKDVSRKSQEYFDRENSVDEIERNIDAYQQ